jgi:hypothetical protein
MDSIDPTRRRDSYADVANDPHVLACSRRPAAKPVELREVPDLPDPSAPLLARAVWAATTQRRLDGFLDATIATYQTPEGAVRVAAPYRWGSVSDKTFADAGYDDAPAGILLHRERVIARNSPELRAIAARLGITAEDLRRVQRGGGRPEHVRRLTQALIDAGRLPATARGPVESSRELCDLASRVRQMMADYGLGYDEGGYVRQAVAHLDPARTALVRVSPATARPGDVFARAPGVPVGILSRTREPSAAEEAELRKQRGFATGRIVAYEIDSSHGDVLADVDHGGVARETWWHDEQSGAWRGNGVVPAFDAVYRPVAPGRGSGTR